jgi:hypothetical protein
MHVYCRMLATQLACITAVVMASDWSAGAAMARNTLRARLNQNDETFLVI